ncbi:hypothetical protein OPT61_g838 [Boeremia exigua]|uniref:Uncharacterized protein n=1 Tax=Boeremia exigua TaxID=749465 RepID=A0ACC2ISR9_9PLEO|nr:hypothetical protein OPT61_g838 [Boeremia exigua]
MCRKRRADVSLMVRKAVQGESEANHAKEHTAPGCASACYLYFHSRLQPKTYTGPFTTPNRPAPPTSRHRSTMCYLHHMYEYQDEWSEQDAVPRSVPRLAWALPVDAAELCASLDTFAALLPHVQTLRLCHRFGSGSLSTLPLELLDLILKMLYESVQAELKRPWDSDFACFQGLCTSPSHLMVDDNEVERLWNDMFGPEHKLLHEEKEKYDDDEEEESQYTASYEIHEKRDMVEDALGESWDYRYEMIVEAHQDIRQRWLDKLCPCKKRSSLNTNAQQTAVLQKTLRSHFGLEVFFLHESFSARMKHFLPDADDIEDQGLFTSCFLTLPRKLTADTVSRSGSAKRNNKLFMNDDERTAFRQKLDVGKLTVSEKDSYSFTRALRILNIQPSFHLTDLEPSLRSDKVDNTLSKISHLQLSGWPKGSRASVTVKVLRLKHYLECKNKDIRTQHWPQLMLLATSDVVAPTV